MPQTIEFPDIGATIEIGDDASQEDIQEAYDQLSQGRFSSAVNRGLKTIQSDTGASITGAARGAAMARNAASGATARQIAMQSAMSGGDIPANLPRSTPQTRTADLEESSAYQLGKDIQDRAEETFRTNPRYADSAAETLASGLGSVAALAPSALAGPAGPLAAGAAYGLNAGERAYQEAIDTVDRRIAEAMAAGDAATAERLEREKGRLAENAYLKNVPIGAGTEAAMGVAGRLVPLGRGRTLGKSFDQGLDRVVPRSINPVARAATKSGVEGAVREGVQETAEQGLQNLAALEYDPDRAFTEGMLQSGAGGAGVGFIVGGGAGAANRVNRQMRVKEWRDSRRADKTGATSPVEEPPLTGETEADRAAQAIVDDVAPVLPESAAALETVVAQAEAAPVVEPVQEMPVVKESFTTEPIVEPTPTVEESSVVAPEPAVAPEVAPEPTVAPTETAVTSPEVAPEPTESPQPDASVFEALTSDEFLNALDDYGSAEGPPLGVGVADKWVKAVETVKTGSLPVEEIQKGINEAWITTDGRVLTLHVEGYNNDAELKQDNVSVWVDEDGRVHMMATNAVPRLRSFAINKIFKMLNGKPTPQQAPKRLPTPEPISSDIPTPQATPPTTQPDAPLVEGAVSQATTPDAIYDAALEVSRQASRDFRKAQKAYRAREIGDAEFLEAQKKFDESNEAFDIAERAFIESQNQPKKPRGRKPKVAQTVEAAPVVPEPVIPPEAITPEQPAAPTTDDDIEAQLVAARKRAAEAQAIETDLIAQAPPANPIGPWDAWSRKHNAARNALVGAEGTVARLEQQKLNRKLGTPGAVKPQAPVTTKALKTQREFLLDAVSSALDSAPEEGLDTVTFDVPGDGVFTVVNNKANLKAFRDRVEKRFPKGIQKNEGPKLPSGESTTVPAIGTKTPETADLSAFASEDETRPTLQQTQDEGDLLIATDGSRMAIVETSKPSKPGSVEGYPNWRQVIPTTANRLASRVPTKDIWHLANEAWVFIKGIDKPPGATLYRNPDGTLGISIKHPEVGEFTGNVQPKAVTLSAINPKFLVDAMKLARNLGDSEVDLYQDDAVSPLYIRGSNSTQIIMPMRLDGAKGKQFAADFTPGAHPSWNFATAPKAPETAPKAEAKPKAKTKRAGKPKPGQYAEPTAPTADVFDPSLTDEQIADFFPNDRAPVPGEFRGSRLTFATYDEFRDWMDARFAENDLEGISAGLKDSDSAMKVRYIKENRSGDPNKRDVISHLATGSPLPAGWTPTPRTTPRPNPPSMGGTSAPATPSPARPAQPPPPPRTPSGRTPFSIPALVQLLRMFGKYPRIDRTLKGSYGRYGQGSEQVDLKGRLLWDRDLATRVLSHEIGHFIDLAIEKFGKGKQFANRWQPLLLFKKKLAEKQALLAAAKSLSRDWRGPFSADDQYRNDVKELFADAMSAILTDPEWVNKRHPLIHDTFQDLLKGKPAFNRAYNTLTDWLRGGEIPKVASRQLGQAMRESRRKLAVGIPFLSMTPWDMFQQKVVDPFFRAQQIEGNPGTLGDRAIDRLGRLRSMPAMMAALLKDDWLKTVQPALNKIKGGGEAARDVFGKYLTANRVVNERRASGAWIEQNPTEALEVMRKITESNPLLSSWRGQLAKLGDNPSGPALYDFAAEMFREVHDKGEEAVKSVADSINELDLGLDGDAALMAFNVRGKLLNPSGVDVSTAQQILADIDNDLTPEERTALRDAASALFEINHKVMEAMRDMGLISPRAWKEIVEPNRNNYVPFAVADYWQGTVGAGMKPQWGTAKDIIDPVVALQQKLGASFRWMQKQAQVQALINAYATAGYDVTQTAKRLRFASDVASLRAKHRNDDTSVLLWWKKGVPYAIELHDDPGHSFETAVERPMDARDLARVLHSGWLGGLTRANRALLALYTTFSASFLGYRNVIRDFKTTSQHIGYARVARALASKDHITPLARNYAAAGFGNTPMLPEVRKLVEMGALPPPAFHHLVANTPEEVEQMLLDGRLLANEVKLQRDGVIPSRVGKAIKAPIEAIEQLGALQEAASKILAYRAAKLRPGMSDARATELARRSGIPLPGIGGTSMWMIDMIYSWSRVSVQGLRGTIDILKDPELGKEMRARVIALELIPRLVKYGFASGLVGMATGGSGGDDDDGIAGTIGEFYRRVSPYKVAIDMVTPLVWYDTRTGKYVPLWKTFGMKASQIPKYYEAVGWRRPSSEEGKLWGSMMYSALAGLTPDKTGKGGQGVVAGLADWLKTTATPGVNPTIKFGSMIGSLVSGTNPIDEFRGQPAANRDMYEAGGVPAVQAGVGAVLNQAGDAGAIVALGLESMGLLPEEATKSAKSFSGRMQAAISKTPVIKGIISHDNYADYRDETVAKKDELRYRSQMKLLMTPEIREMYDYYNANSQRTEKLDAHERTLFNIASQWHSNVYGSASKIGTVANKAIASIKKQDQAPMLDRATNFMNGNDSRFKASVKQELIDRSQDALRRFAEAKKP